MGDPAVKEGMRRLGIVLRVLGFLGGAAYSCFLGQEVWKSWSAGVLKESLLADCSLLLTLPIAGFLIPWGATRTAMWIFAGFSK